MASGSNNESSSHFYKFLNVSGYRKDVSRGNRRQTFVCSDGKLGQFSLTTKGNKPQSRQFYQDVTYLYTYDEDSDRIYKARVVIDENSTPTRAIPKCGTKGFNIKMELANMQVVEF